MASGYKKYMKKERGKGGSIIKIFIVSFFGMLLICTMIFNYLSKVMTVDTSIGDYKEQQTEIEDKKIVDMNSLEMIQNEDQGRNFSDLMSQPETSTQNEEKEQEQVYDRYADIAPVNQTETLSAPTKETVYKVFIGTYTSAEQARAANEIIQESGSGLSPIVKCLGASNYTLQAGIFKSKQSAEALLSTIQQSHLPGRIVQEN
jgi:hypothetical protein